MSSTTRSVALTAGILSLALTLAGCGTTLVSGQASSAEPPITDVAPADFPITGAAETEADVTARNALADLNDFWAQQFPDVYGEDFPALTGGYFSVDPGDVDESLYPGGEIGCSSAPEEVEQNAFYCPPDVGASNEDSISYDRAFLQELADQYGRFLPALIMAHEFGHAVQGRVGYPAGDTSINVETQADCFAGAWTKWVADGNAMHETIRAPELDGLLAGYFIVRDPRAPAPRTARRTARTSTGSRPSRTASTAGPRPAGTTTSPTGCSPRPSSPTSRSTRTTGTCRSTRSPASSTSPCRSTTTTRSPTTSARTSSPRPSSPSTARRPRARG
ncbi:neutral zinc metallopeptidase [Klenkia terrae]|uniref:neutral zinc metallopeptidase n=1 Tax=Klenkia terrae TaxID=1052259 RepID=UPI00360925A3